MQTKTIHPALRPYRAGRGYGVMIAFEVDYGLVGSGRSAHVLHDGRPLCGVRGEVVKRIDGADPRAEIVERNPCCVTCREKLGDVPNVEYARDVEAAA